MTKTETFLYKPSISSSDFKVVMAYPAIYSFAMASLGYLWLFKQLDEAEDICAERIYSDSTDLTFNPATVDMIGFSFSFDLDFLEVFSMLEKYGIPLKAAERNDDFPLIFSGGPVVTANPEPYKQIFDFFIIGDGEDVNLEAVRLCKANKGKTKGEVLHLLSELDGVYVPKFPKVVKKVVKKISECIYTPILSEEAFFQNTFVIEMARGCANRCGFCLASYLNLPLRCIPYETLIETIDLGLKYTNKIALLGAQISAHPRFLDICNYIYEKIQSGKEIEMSVSSLRVDAITPDVIKTLKAAGQKNCTLAIEAGSERLRKVINKNLTEEQIFNAVKIARESGLKGFKFYGMIGIPTETQEDLEAIVSLAKRIKHENKGFDISFGVSSFVPKPHTPFQWCGRESTKSLEKKSSFLQKELHKIGVTAHISSIKWDFWQAVLSRGDENIGDFLIEVYKQGGKLGAFKSSAKKCGIDAEYLANADFDMEKSLPWDFIKLQPKKEFLIQENKRLLSI